MFKWQVFKDKYLGKIFNWTSFAVGILGIIITVISLTSPSDAGWIVALVVIVLNNVWLIASIIYESYVTYKVKEVSNNAHKDKDDYENKIRVEQERRVAAEEKIILCKKSNSEYTVKLLYYFEFVCETLNKYSTRLLEVNYKYSEDDSNVDTFDNLLPNDILSSSNVGNHLTNLKVINRKTYENSMKREFNHFLKDITDQLRIILEFHLLEKGISLPVSIAVKQYNKIVNYPDDLVGVSVITTFRDHQTYSQGEREIGTKEYSINNNSDFVHCLNKPWFIKNNMTDDDTNYSNENSDYLKYYNCTIVVPIKYEYSDKCHIFGYLACDTLNQDLSITNIFDNKAAQIMQITANIIAAYFDSMDFQWAYELSKDFLDIVYNMKINNSEREKIRV